MHILDRIRRHEDYIHVFDSPQGERVLRHLCKKANVFEPTFVVGDPNQTALREGRRQLVLSILREVFGDHAALYDQLKNGMMEDGQHG